MKKFRSQILILLLLLSVIMTACLPNLSKPEEELVGQWAFSSMENGNKYYAVDLEFTSDGKLLSPNNGRLTALGITYDQISPGKIKIFVTNESAILNYELDNDILKIYFDNGYNQYMRKRSVTKSTPENVEEIIELNRVGSNLGALKSLSWCPDGNIFAVSSFNGDTFLIDSNTLEIRDVIVENSVQTIKFSSKENILASASYLDNFIRVWDIDKLTIIHTLAGHTSGVRSISFSPDGQTLASGSDDKTVRLWDINTGSLLHTFVGHDDWVSCVTFSPDGQTLVSGSYGTKDCTARFWDLKTGKQINLIQIAENPIVPVGFEDLEYTKDGKLLVMLNNHGYLSIYDVSSGVELKVIQRLENVHCFALSPDGNTLAVGTRQDGILLLNIITLEIIQKLGEFGIEYESECIYSPDGLRLALINGGLLHLWDVKSGEKIYELGEPTHSPTPLATTEPTPDVYDNDSEMILIPAGEFQMGCDPAHNGGFECQEQALPLHTVYLDDYYIDKYEVTNAKYAECVDAGYCSLPYESVYYGQVDITDYFDNPTFKNYPVIVYGHEQAQEYCSWAGKRLPTEAEWEKAARGTSPIAYPWGDEAPDCQLANQAYGVSGYSYLNCSGSVSEIGSHGGGISPYGVHDMAGNVSEWVNDYYSDNYYSWSPNQNPQGPTADEATEFFPLACPTCTQVVHVLRGGNYGDEGAALTTSSRLYQPLFVVAEAVGIRCAADGDYDPNSLSTPSPASFCPGSPPQRLEVGEQGKVCTKSDSLRLRKSPGTGGEIIASVKTGTQFDVIGGPECAGSNWSWWQVQLNDGQIGWLAEGGDDIDPYFLCPLD